MIATLPMYDRPETWAANDRFWGLVRDALRDRGMVAPDELDRGAEIWGTWQSPNLVLSQTCGLPYRTKLHGHVALIGAPVWDLDVPPGMYASVIVARAGERPGATARVAVNAGDSQSGWAALVEWAGAPPKAPVITGAHAASAHAVAEGRTDLAAIDIATWEMIQRYDTWADQLHVIAQTRPTPALPYIAAKDADAAATLAALKDAVRALGQSDRDTLLLKDVTAAEAGAYLAVPTPAAPRVAPG